MPPGRATDPYGDRAREAEAHLARLRQAEWKRYPSVEYPGQVLTLQGALDQLSQTIRDRALTARVRPTHVFQIGGALSEQTLTVEEMAKAILDAGRPHDGRGLCSCERCQEARLKLLDEDFPQLRDEWMRDYERDREREINAKHEEVHRQLLRQAREFQAAKPKRKRKRIGPLAIAIAAVAAAIVLVCRHDPDF